MLTGPFLFNLHTVLKRAAIKKSKNDLIHAEEGEDHFTDICSVGEYWLRIPRGLDLHLNVFTSCFLRAAPLVQKLQYQEGELSLLLQQHSACQNKWLCGFTLSPMLPCSAIACRILEKSPAATLGESVLCWPYCDSAWNMLIHANEAQICQMILLSLTCCGEERKWTLSHIWH